ncbi:SUMO-activating enzyme subunit 1 [Patella vulgata]|uniref:SUMO-activating enzyme subunit 1 n=1 Tax=Patella vulgata TaxID=6465 RepID=UPI00217F6FDF|nr:SUMO-activating enzyme subunit 1 [Patella vulgata]
MGEENITEAEAALYDRQIRLWGLDAQKRLRAAKVLLIGIKGLGAEVAKNIVLSGIKSLTILDHTQVDEEDKLSQFLIPQADIGKNRALSSLERTQLLNPMVNVTADTDDVADKNDEFFKQYDVICAACCPSSLLCKINNICSENNIKYFAGDVFGYYGYMFADLGKHEFAEEVPKLNQKQESSQPDEECGDGEPAPKKIKKDEKETVVVKKEEIFSRLQSALDVDWSTTEIKTKIKRTPTAHFITLAIFDFMEKNKRRPQLSTSEEDSKQLLECRKMIIEKNQLDDKYLPENFIEHCFAELSPVCAIVGGVLGQEIIKAVSQKDAPHNNFFFYNGVEGTGMVDKIGN